MVEEYEMLNCTYGFATLSLEQTFPSVMCPLFKFRKVPAGEMSITLQASYVNVIRLSMFALLQELNVDL